MTISVVAPVYNEAENIAALLERLGGALEKLGKEYEIILVNDGSSDASLELMKAARQKNSAVKIVDFARNFGQHAAIAAGFAFASGDCVITIDADLQNPPEDVAKIFAQFEMGHDAVGTIRRGRKDGAFRKYASIAANKIRKMATKIPITDQGCMMRGYSREIAKTIAKNARKNTFIPLMGYLLAKNPTEIFIGHSPRNAGKSKYGMLSLAKLGLMLFGNGKAAQSDDKIKYEVRETIGF